MDSKKVTSKSAESQVGHDFGNNSQPKPKSIRLGASIKAQNKEMLDLIARSEKFSINETLDYIISKYAHEFTIDGKSVYEWVNPPHKNLARYYLTTKEKHLTFNELNFEMKKNSLYANPFLTYLIDLKNLPESFLDASYIFTCNVIRSLDANDLLRCFEYTLLIDLIWSEHKNAVSETAVINQIVGIFSNLDNGNILDLGEYLELSKMTRENADLNVVADYLQKNARV